MRWIAWALVPMLAGCWVTPEMVSEKRGGLDPDGDGSPNREDCADEVPEQGVGLPEIPYDGWDNDCAGGDLLDADSDGFPGILYEDWIVLVEANGSQLSWPASLDQKAPIDCNDDDASIKPGAVEIPYDGVHTNCDTRNDFDVDGDGYTSLEAKNVDYDAYLAAYPDADVTGVGDCDDRDSGVFPGAADVFYDGVDADCDFDNDFDADKDGFVPAEFYSDFLLYAARPGYGDLTAQSGDCLDMDMVIDGAVEVPGFVCGGSSPLSGGVVLGAAVKPGACDEPLDGIDADCLGDDDFDYDEDGITSEAYAAAFNDYVTAWGLDLVLPALLDCDDYSADVYPGALEVLGDNQDSDCFGVDEARLTPSAYAWTNPGTPVLTLHSDRRYSLVTYADELQGTLVGQSNLGYRVLSFDAPDPGEPRVVNDAIEVFSQPAAPLAMSRHAAASVGLANDELFLAGSAVTSGGSSALVLGSLGWTPTFQRFTTTDADIRLGEDATTPYSNQDVLVSTNDTVFYAACRAGEVLWRSTTSGGPTTSSQNILASDTACSTNSDCVLGDTCALFTSPTGVDSAILVTCDGNLCDGWTLDATTSTATLESGFVWGNVAASQVSSRDGVTANERVGTFVSPDGDAFVVPPTGFSLIEVDIPGVDIVRAEAAWSDDTILLGVVGDDASGTRNTWLVLTDNTGELLYELDLDTAGTFPGLSAVDITLELAPGEVGLAVVLDGASAGDDGQVAWAFWSWNG